MSRCRSCSSLESMERILAAKFAGAWLSSRPVMGISMNFWNAVMTAVPATPATTPGPTLAYGGSCWLMDSSYPRERGAKIRVRKTATAEHGHEARARLTMTAGGRTGPGSCPGPFSRDRHEDVRMKRYEWAMAAIVVALVVAFVVVEAADVAILTEPGTAMSSGGAVAALVGVGLLVGDVVLPVASSLVMLAHGALFGVVLGALLSLVGTIGAALAGVWIGRRGERLLGVPAEDRRRARELVDRWGMVAIVATRPVPVLAEATAIMAGATGASALRVSVAAAAGGLPAAVFYALAGSLVMNVASGAVVFVAVVALAAGFWVVSTRRAGGRARQAA